MNLDTNTTNTVGILEQLKVAEITQDDLLKKKAAAQCGSCYRTHPHYWYCQLFSLNMRPSYQIYTEEQRTY